MQEKPDAAMTYGQATRVIFRTTCATVPLQLIRAAFPLTTGVVLSQSSDVAVRQSAVLINSCLNFTNVINSPLLYVQPMASGVYGNDQEDKRNIGQTAHAGWLLAVILSVPQGLILGFSRPILILFGQSPNVSEVVQRFFNIGLWATPLHNLQITSGEVMLGVNKFYFPIIVELSALVAYGLMAYPLMFGVWGAPPLGIAGIAYARLTRGGIYNVLTVGGLILMHKKAKNFLQFEFFKFKKEGFLKRIGDLCRGGRFVSVIILSEIGVIYVVNVLAGTLSTHFLTPQLIVSQYQDAVLIFTSAVGLTALKEIAENNTKGSKTIMRLGNISTAISIIIPLVFVGLTVVCPTLLIHPFTDPAIDTNAVNILIDHKVLLVSGLGNLFLAPRYVLTMALIGTGHLNALLVGNVMLTWAGVLCGIAFAFGGGFDGMISLHVGLALGFLLSAVAQGINWVCKGGVNASPPDHVSVMSSGELSLSEVEDESRTGKSVEVLTSSTSPGLFSQRNVNAGESTRLLDRPSRCVIC